MERTVQEEGYIELKKNNLNSDYSVEIDSVSKKEWEEILKNFSDANIYQTWSYGAVRWGEKNLSHCVLKKDGEIAAAAQVRIVKVPLINAGIAYVTCGPMWQSKKSSKNILNLQQMIRALSGEYVSKRSFFLRVIPLIIKEKDDLISTLFKEEGFRLNLKASSYRTLVVDLLPSETDLWANIKKKWRYYLRQAEKNELQLKEGTDQNLFDRFKDLYEEMHKRKKFIEYYDINKFRAIQEDLPEVFKMKILLAESQEDTISALVWSEIGDTAIILFSATADKGLELYSSYLLWWHTLLHLKTQGARMLDEGGIDPEGNPGVYHYKAGLGGKDVRHIGQYEACRSIISSSLVKNADIARGTYQKLREKLKKNQTSLQSS